MDAELPPHPLELALKDARTHAQELRERLEAALKEIDSLRSKMQAMQSVVDYYDWKFSR